MHGIPILRLKKDDVPVVAHYVHTHPSLRGTLSLLWAVDHRPHEARYELFYLFTLAEHRDWLLLSTDCVTMTVSFIPSHLTSMRRNGMSEKFEICSASFL